MADYDLIIATPDLYVRALAEVKRGDAHPIALAIVASVTQLGGSMHEAETTCILCDAGDAYLFDVAEPPDEFLVMVPAEDETLPPIAGPICARCAALADKAKVEKARASMRRLFGEEASERRPN
jgi:hypothetical protein